MDIKTNLRIIWAITAKDISDAIKNKIVQGILVGVGFLMLSSQALPWLASLRDDQIAYFWDQGKSIILKDIVRAHDLKLRPQDGLVDLQHTISLASDPMIGIVFPDDFDKQVDSGKSIHLNAYQANWAEPGSVSDSVVHFEENLGRITGVQIKIDIDKNLIYPPADEIGFPMMIASGLVLGVITVGLILTPYLIIEERETHTLDVLLISPARITHLLVGKSLVGLFYSLTSSIVIVLFSWQWLVHLHITALAVLLGGLCAVNIGLLIGAVIKDFNSVNAIMGLVIAGFMLPLFLWTSAGTKLPQFLLSLFEILPSISMYKIVRQSFTAIINWNVVGLNILILLSWVVLILVLVVWNIQRYNQ